MFSWLAALGFALPSAKLTPHKPVLNLRANLPYLSSLLRFLPCAGGYLLLLLLCLFVCSRGFGFVFAFLSRASVIVTSGINYGSVVLLGIV